eukprot:TRINITY_DN1381_c0_g1_i1.p1 TRINITY_DN1381_c0_g1~~TRINITY_DN1381_c0_g1_i1.p1  ORF type:complete len:152 (+),score=11.55 TRINITY_DN1381_c0_g1_i1:56-511(+)
MLRHSGFMACRGAGRGLVARRWCWSASEARARQKQKPEKKMGMMDMVRKYGLVAGVLTSVEYLVATVIIFLGVGVTGISSTAITWVGKENVDSMRESIVSWPVVGPYASTLKPETVTDLVLTLLLNEITWYARAPFLMLAVPKVAAMVGRA